MLEADTITMDYENTLKNLGLLEKEIKVYLSLLQLGRATAYHIANRSGVKKSTTYIVLDSLINKGFAKKHRKTSTLEYIPVEPKVIFENAKQRVLDTEQDITGLQSILHQEEQNIKVTWYEGIEGIREMHQQLFKAMRGKSYISFYSHIDDIPDEVLRFFQHHQEMHKKYRIKRRALTVDDAKVIEGFYAKGLNKLYNIQAKALPRSKYDSKISIDVYGDSVQIFSQRAIHGVIIEDKDIADFFRNVFEIIWEQKEWKKLYGKKFDKD